MKKSFTLVELMIVIAILAILAAIVIFALNPSEIFKKNRDSVRMTDLNTLNKAIVFMSSWNTSEINLGTSTYIYLSLPDSSPTCSSYALATLPTGYQYSCVTSTIINNVDGTGWVPVSFALDAGNNYISKLPVDPVNNINYYYSYNPGGSFEINAFLESRAFVNDFAMDDGGDSMNALEQGTDLFDMPTVFPHNWIKIPGNSFYGTSDFWVMQYETKYSIDGRKASNSISMPACRASEDMVAWDWAKSCGITWNTSNIISSPYGDVLAGTTHNDSKAICTALGGHLITNSEWMTIARNIEQQPSNWTSGEVGLGYLFNGNSSDTNRGYIAFPNSPAGNDVDSGINRNIRASHILSNGNRIYDLAGNSFENVQFDINDTLLANLPNDGGATGWRYPELSALINPGDFLSLDQIQPSNPDWDSGQGIGTINTNTAVQSNKVITRGGECFDMSDAGVYSMRLYRGPTSDAGNGAVTTRCVR